MTKLNQIYKCNVCGNIVEMVHTGVGQLVCCGEPMELMEEKTQDQGAEKHLPVISKVDKGIKVTIGSVEHPMTPEHYIEWVEIFFDLPTEALAKEGVKVSKKFLQPVNAPEAVFQFIETPENIAVRAYCNVHGLWKASLDNND